tara:strand:+ start:391 stop:528 length:138 start_codon:yes stop_codon:yes gene_type:complete
MKNYLIDYSVLGKLAELITKHGWKLLIVYFIFKIFISIEIVKIII